MQTSTYDFTVIDTWVMDHPEAQEFVDAMKSVLNEGMDFERLIDDLEHVRNLRPGEWEQALREAECNTL